MHSLYKTFCLAFIALLIGAQFSSAANVEITAKTRGSRVFTPNVRGKFITYLFSDDFEKVSHVSEVEQETFITYTGQADRSERLVDKEGGAGYGEKYFSVKSGSVSLKRFFYKGGLQARTNYFGYYHGNAQIGNSISLYNLGELVKTFTYAEISEAIRAPYKPDEVAPESAFINIYCHDCKIDEVRFSHTSDDGDGEFAIDDITYGNWSLKEENDEIDDNAKPPQEDNKRIPCDGNKPYDGDTTDSSGDESQTGIKDEEEEDTSGSPVDTDESGEGGGGGEEAEDDSELNGSGKQKDKTSEKNAEEKASPTMPSKQAPSEDTDNKTDESRNRLFKFIALGVAGGLLLFATAVLFTFVTVGEAFAPRRRNAAKNIDDAKEDDNIDPTVNPTTPDAEEDDNIDPYSEPYDPMSPTLQIV